MKILLANHSSAEFHYLSGKYGDMGWLLGPSSLETSKIRPWTTFALDNDAFGSFDNGIPWDEKKWLDMIEYVKVKKLKPEWILMPDKVGDKAETLRKWRAYTHLVSGYKLAFAVQDGMVPQDVPVTADVIFVGGTLEWKWKTLSMWANAFPRVHVGRVNTLTKLLSCERFNVESVDGTHWFRFRAPEEWMEDLVYFFEQRHQQQLTIPDIDV